VSKNYSIQRKETLKLNEWELANLHLPPVTTVTLYEGSAPVGFLRSRVAKMLEKNPWLTSRIVKKDTTDGVVAMAYTKGFDAQSATEEYFSVYEPGEIGLSLSMPYEELVRCLLPVQCSRSKPATDENEVLFKVAVVPVEPENSSADQTMPLQQTITSPGFALVVSMNHTLGDGHSYYHLYNMLDADTRVEEFDPVRISDFEAAKTEVIGEKETALLSSTGLAFGIMGTYLGTKFSRRGPQNILVNEVNSAWVTAKKVEAKKEVQVPYVSSNDVLTSWFFSEMNSDINLMLVNLRERQPSVLDLSDEHVGNYEANLPFFPGDIESPALIRQSIRSTDGTFRAKRAGVPETEAPGLLKLLRNRTSIITNWATFYRDVNLQDDAQENGESRIKPKLHFPVMEPDGIITSVWNNAIVFRPRAGELGMLMITRRFDNATFARESEMNSPLGKRII
jgi:hypothetical protein